MFSETLHSYTPLTDRQVIARLMVIAQEQPEHAEKVNTLIAKVRTMGYISNSDAMSLGCKVRYWNPQNGFHPERGQTVQNLHYLNCEEIAKDGSVI